MSDYLTNFMNERRKAEEYLRSDFGTEVSSDEIIKLITKAVRILREDAIEREVIAKLNAPNLFMPAF